MKKHVILTILLLFCALSTGQAQRDLSQDQVAAYVTLVKADRARNKGDVSAAAAGYREAQQAFQAIARKDPRWQPDVVKYRLAYCENELEKLTRQASGTMTPSPSPAAAASAAETASSLVTETTGSSTSGLRPPAEPDPAVQAELASLRQQVGSLQQLAPLTNEVARLQQEKDQLGRELDELKNAKPAAVEPDPQLAKLAEDNEDLQKKIAKLEKATEGAKDKSQRRLEKELAELKAERERLEGEVKEAQAAAKKPAAEIAELSDKLKAAEEQANAQSEEKKRWESDLQAAQQLAESRLQELTTSAQNLDTARAQVAQLTQEKEQAASAATVAVPDTQQVEQLSVCEKAREEMTQQLVALRDELQALKAQHVAAVATTTSAEPAGDLGELQRSLLDMGEQLASAGRQLDTTRDSVLALLTKGQAK